MHQDLGTNKQIPAYAGMYTYSCEGRKLKGFLYIGLTDNIEERVKRTKVKNTSRFGN